MGVFGENEQLFRKMVAANVASDNIAGVLSLHLARDKSSVMKDVKAHLPDGYSGGKKIYVPQPYSIEKDIGERLKALRIEIRRNARSDFKEYSRDGGETWHKLNDAKCAMLLSDLEKDVCTVPYYKEKTGHVKGLQHKKVRKDEFNNVIEAIASRNTVDTFKVWLESLPKWDKKERLGDVFLELFCCGSDESNLKLARWAFRSVLVAAVYRTFIPGFKHDEMVILCGPEGIGKSSMWNQVLPDAEYFSDNLDLSCGTKERLENILGCVLVENAELSGLRKSDLNSLKAFITRQHDTVRLSYRRNPEVFPRQFVLVGTTNDPRALPNDVGNRRFLPVDVQKKEELTPQENAGWVSSYMEKNRKQLWAEALHLYGKREKCYLPSDLCSEAQSAREQHRSRDEFLESKVTEWLKKWEDDGFETPFHMSQLLQGTGLDTHIAAQKNVAQFLRTLGYESKRYKIGAQKVTKWRKGGGDTL